jgi:protein O-GlcNAc transferase
MLALEQFNLAVEEYRQGHFAESATRLDRVLDESPRHVDALHLRGVIALKLGDGGRAIELIERAAAIHPSHAQMLTNLGNAYRSIGDYPRAFASYERAIGVDPRFFPAFLNLGAAHLDLCQHSEALRCFKRADELNPGDARIQHAVASALRPLDRLDEALSWVDRASEPDPHFFEAVCERAAILCAQGDLKGGLEEYRRASQLRPEDPLVWANAGLALHQHGRSGDGMAFMAKAMELDSGNAYVRTPYLFALNFCESDRDKIFREHRREGDLLVSRTKRVALPARSRVAPERIRVGYVSPDFRRHAVMQFFEPILAAHDHESFRIFCYSDGRAQDEVTARLRGQADDWRDTAGLSDDELSRLILEDEIDILVDLAGHTRDSRMTLFAMKPAPIQVSWFGYMNTTGLPTMDYRLTDDHLAPPGCERFYSEKLVRLPRSMGYRPEPLAPPIDSLPALRNGFVTFGSFNSIRKLSPEVIALWARLLHEVQGSRLRLIVTAGEKYFPTVLEQFKDEGISGDRVSVIPWQSSWQDYLARFQEVDLALDPFPVPGGVTTAHSLWMGVPVITLEGQSEWSRISAAVLRYAGLSEFIVDTQDEYVTRARSWAERLGALTDLRHALRSRMPDESRAIAANVESAYRSFLRRL